MRRNTLPQTKSVSRMLAAIACAAICVTGILSTTGCGASGSSESPAVTTSTDTAVMKNLFPNLEGVEAVEMEQHKYGGSDGIDLLPGPTDYQYMGYITLSDDAATKYADTYDFKEVTTPKVFFTNIQQRDGQWRYSYEFGKDIIKKGLVGNVWMDGNTLLFSVGTM